MTFGNTLKGGGGGLNQPHILSLQNKKQKSDAYEILAGLVYSIYHACSFTVLRRGQAPETTVMHILIVYII